MVTIRCRDRLVNSWFLLNFILQVSSMAVQIELTPNEFAIPTATRVRIRCTTDGNDSKLVFTLLRQRYGQTNTEVVAREPGVTVIGTTSRRLAKDFHLVLTTQDNNAELFCELSTPGDDSKSVRSIGMRLNVTFPPDSVHVSASPLGPVTESVSKVFTCELNLAGSNPPSTLQWTQLDSAGAQLPMTDVEITPTKQISSPTGAYVARSTLTVRAKRASNGRRFECVATYMQKKTLLRSEEILEVLFAPNNVRLSEKPMGGVRESDRLELTCKTSACHPPSVIRWFEVPSQAKVPNPSTNELTDLAQLDGSPGEYGGTSVSSTLVVTKTYRSHQNTIFRCQVEHPGLEKPVINEHRLQILYPPSVQLLSVPQEPVVGQTVILACQTSGGNPQDAFRYTWFAESRSQFAGLLDVGSDNTKSSSLKNNSQEMSTRRLKELNQPSTPSAPEFKNLVRMRTNQDSQLNFTQVGLAQRGWYACEVSSSGGEAHALAYLDLFYQPIIDRRTKQHIAAHLGESISFTLYVDANPPSVEVTWFQLNNVIQTSIPAGYPRQYDTFYSSSYPYQGYEDLYEYRVRRTVYSGPNRISRDALDRRQSRKQVGDGTGEKRHIVAEKSEKDNLTFTLSFFGVQNSDFGEYLCQVRHRLGLKEFYFHLTKKPNTDGILPSSINVTQRGPTTVVRYKPPEKPPYTRLVLRVCRRDASGAGKTSSSTITQADQNLGPGNPSNTGHVRDPRFNPMIEPKQTQATQNSGCEDYHVAKPQSGETEIHLSDAVQLYNFRLLMYQGTRVIRETPPVLWQPEVAGREVGLRTPVLALAVTGACLFLLLILVLVGFFFACRNKKKPGMSPTSDGIKNTYPNCVSPGTRPGPGTETEMHRLQTCGFGSELRSDMGSMRSFQPSENDTALLMHRTISTPNGTFEDRLTGLSPHHSYITEGDYGSLARHPLSTQSTSVTNMAVLNNRIIAEAYLAAARAASAAVVASVVSGSTEIYSPSTQLTGDMESSVLDVTEQDRSMAREQAPASSDSRDGTYKDDTSRGGIEDTSSTRTDKTGIQREGLRTNCSASQQNVAKGPETRPGSARRRSDALTPNARHGSRLSVQTRLSNTQSHSHWGSITSGVSYSSLNPASQANLEAAARAAAAAAVASVVQNMNMGLLMQHASSSNNLHIPYGLPRSSSRAASVVGQPVGHLFNKPGTESGDGESLHSVAFGPRYFANPCNSTGELTPTASLHQFDMHMMPTSSSHRLTVPVPHRPHHLQRPQLPAKSETGSGFRYGKALSNSPRPNPSGISRASSSAYHSLARDSSSHKITATRPNGRSQTSHIQQATPVYTHSVPPMVSGNVPCGSGYANPHLIHPQSAQLHLQPHPQQYIQSPPPGMWYPQFPHPYPVMTQYQGQPVYYQHPGQNHFQPPRIQNRQRLQTPPNQQQQDDYQEHQSYMLPPVAKPMVNHSNTDKETTSTTQKAEYTVEPQLHSTGESHASGNPTTITEARGLGEGQLSMDDSSPVQQPSIPFPQEPMRSKVPEHPTSRAHSDEKAGETNTLERPDNNGNKSISQRSTEDLTLNTPTKNHGMSSHNEPSYSKVEEESPKSPSHRQSPMGASFDAIGNGFSAAEENALQKGEKTNPPACRPSHPIQYKQQPRLGVFSATRLGKPVDRVATSTSEHTPLLMDSHVEMNSKFNASQTAQHNSQTEVPGNSVTNGF